MKAKSIGLFFVSVVLGLPIVSRAGDFSKLAQLIQSKCEKELTEPLEAATPAKLTFSPDAIRGIKQIGLQNDIERLQESFTGTIVPGGRFAGQNSDWTILVSHGKENDRFTDICVVAKLNPNRDGTFTVNKISYADEYAENFFWYRLAIHWGIKDRMTIPVSLKQVLGNWSGELEIASHIAAKVQFKHGISLIDGVPIVKENYLLERMSPGNFDSNTLSFRIETIAPQVSRRLIMILSQPFRRDTYRLVSLYENHFE